MATRPRKSEAKPTPEKGTAAKATANGKANGAKAAVAKTVAKATVRKPRAKKAAPVTDEMIAERAYYIALSGSGAGDHENWVRAEAELRTGA